MTTSLARASEARCDMLLRVLLQEANDLARGVLETLLFGQIRPVHRACFATLPAACISGTSETTHDRTNYFRQRPGVLISVQ